MFRCSGRSTCNLEASVSTFGQDPCPRVHKYLEVHFNCTSPRFNSASSSNFGTATSASGASGGIGGNNIGLGSVSSNSISSSLGSGSDASLHNVQNKSSNNFDGKCSRIDFTNLFSFFLSLSLHLLFNNINTNILNAKIQTTCS